MVPRGDHQDCAAQDWFLRDEPIMRMMRGEEVCQDRRQRRHIVEKTPDHSQTTSIQMNRSMVYSQINIQECFARSKPSHLDKATTTPYFQYISLRDAVNLQTSARQ